MRSKLKANGLTDRGLFSADSHVPSRKTGAARAGVSVQVCEVVLPTYMPAAPDKNPMFLEKRVYQGSSGRVYPLPFTDRIEEKSVNRKWKAVWIENEFLRAMVLPEVGGRIHVLQDKSNGYDLIYNQPVIKPALVGLAGPWLSGGIEFNWPQHHRPATFLPVDFAVEEHSDGSKTIWCSDHEPMGRMKGMHGVCLHPNKAYLELKVRAYNRTPYVQTFLWWANVATRVHEAYQSFFPPDVYYVADHARRSMSEYPLARGFYYGVNYGERARKGVPVDERPRQFLPPDCSKMGQRQKRDFYLPDYAPNDLSFYANIPTPCSYMCMGSKEDFFGGYDYAAQAGIVHFANHHISPGKKQWTWGNHEFGYAWDRNLTEPDTKGEYGPYIEIMAGVYTDNQPDFSFLQPGETKTWSQYWYPIQRIGPARHANLDAAIGLAKIGEYWQLGVAATKALPNAKTVIEARGKRLAVIIRDLSPTKPLVERFKLPAGLAEKDLLIRVTDRQGQAVITYKVQPSIRGEVPPPASEPPEPAKLASTDELYLTGVHLEQYRHATRSPVDYWREALKRDPLDCRCNNAIGLWHLRRGEFALAEPFFRRAIERLTRRNANPYDGEAYYNLGLCLRFLNRNDEAYAAFYKATWNQAWVAAAAHALAEMDCTRGNWATALQHLDWSLKFNTDNTRVRDLKTIVLRKLRREAEASALLRSTLALDPVDWWALYLTGEPLCCDLQTALDLALDCARAGLYPEAVLLLKCALDNRPSKTQGNGSPEARLLRLADQNLGAAPMVRYYLGWLQQQQGNANAALAEYRRASALPYDYCFPSRLEEMRILEDAVSTNPTDARGNYYLGNFLYDRRRHAEAIRYWEKAVKLEPGLAVAWRNLGIGCFNVLQKRVQARTAYNRAFKKNPRDARLLYERDQLWKRLGIAPAKRLRELEGHPELVDRRDDLTVELCSLYNQLGHHERALNLVSRRRFQPWEGGEGGPLGQHVRSHVALGRNALLDGDAATAREHFLAALTAPQNLGEARHLLANQSDIHYWLGCVHAALGERSLARKHWLAAATFKGDFQEMSVRAFSEMTYFSALSWLRLGKRKAGHKIFIELRAYARRLWRAPAKIDYFATSLPTLLLFEDNLLFRQQTLALFLQAQAALGLGERRRARALFQRVLKRDPNHVLAVEHLRELSAVQKGKN